MYDWEWKVELGGGNVYVRLDPNAGELARVYANPDAGVMDRQKKFIWKTKQKKGFSGSVVSGTNRAERQLRIEGVFAVLDRKPVTVPECGHLTCAHGLMGCIYEVRSRMGIDEEVETFEPGKEIWMVQVSNTGFPDKDWVVEEGELRC